MIYLTQMAIFEVIVTFLVTKGGITQTCNMRGDVKVLVFLNACDVIQCIRALVVMFYTVTDVRIEKNNNAVTHEDKNAPSKNSNVSSFLWNRYNDRERQVVASGFWANRSFTRKC
jgi:hypothetical protein